MGKSKYDKIDGIIDIYEIPYMICTSIDEFMERYQEVVGLELDKSTSGLCKELSVKIKGISDECYCLLICVFDHSPNTISHECGHAALSVMERIGEFDVISSQEPFCYLLGYLVDKVIDKIDKESLLRIS